MNFDSMLDRYEISNRTNKISLIDDEEISKLHDFLYTII